MNPPGWPTGPDEPASAMIRRARRAGVPDEPAYPNSRPARRAGECDEPGKGPRACYQDFRQQRTAGSSD